MFAAQQQRTPTWDEVERRRALAEAMMTGTGMAPTTIGAALADAGSVLGGILAGRKADRMDAQRQVEADRVFNEAIGGGYDPQPLAAALSGEGTQFVPAQQPGSGLAAALIADFEGFREKPYWDVNALRTGYGSDTITRPDGSVVPVVAGTRVSREDADRDLQRRVGSEFAPIVARAVGEATFAAMPENQRAALTSIAYNYGRLPGSVAGAVRTPGIADDVAAIQGLAGHNDGANAGRRTREAEIYAGNPSAMAFTESQTSPMMPTAPAVNVAMIRALNNPYLSPDQRQTLAAVMQQQQAQQLTPYQAAQLDMDRQEHALRMQQAQQPEAVSWDTRELPNGAVVQVNPVTGETREVVAGQAPGAGFRPATAEEAATFGAKAGQIGPDGRFYPTPQPSGMSVETGPEGQVRVTQGEGVQQAKPFTEGQSKDVVFATRAEGALNDLEPYAEALTSRSGRAADAVPFGLARGLQPPEFQVAQNAGTQFLLAILRKDTGAAVTPAEEAVYGRAFLPQPGDGPEVLQFKKVARRRAVEAMRSGMSPNQILAVSRAETATDAAVAPAGTPPAAAPAGSDAGWTDTGGGIKIRRKN